MSDLETGDDLQEDGEFTYDVVISIPEWVEKSVIEQRAREGLGAPPEVVDRIMESLATHRVVKVKTDVTREKADKTAKLFSGVGFRAEVTHALKLKKLSQQGLSGKVICPACDAKIQPSPDTQCPNCGVVIKNLTPEFLERKRAMKKELEKTEGALRDKRREEDAKRRREFEEKVRAEVRAELEHKYKGSGKRGLFGLPPFVTPVLVLATVAAAFVGGRQFLPGQDRHQVAASAGNTDKGDDIEKVISQTNQLQADMAKLSTANPDALDAKPLIDPKDSLSASGNTAAPAALPGAIAGAPLSEDNKREVANQLILVLAEIGQIERARELIDRAVASHKTGSDLNLSSQLRVIQLEVEAWSIVHGRGDKPQEQIDALTKMLADLPDAGERTIASATIGAILLRRPDLLPQAADGLFSLADESYKAQKTREPRIGYELLVARGRGLLNSAQTRIDRGLRQQAANLTGQLGTMTRIAPEPIAAVLYGFDQQLSRMMGNTEGAKASLEMALTKTLKMASLQQQAATLRSLADGEGIYADNSLQNTLSALSATAEKRGGSEYAQVLYEIGLMHAHNGNEVALHLIQQKLADISKTKPDTVNYEERLRGLAEVALAWKARKNGNPAQVETHLRQAAAMVSDVLEAPVKAPAASAAASSDATAASTAGASAAGK